MLDAHDNQGWQYTLFGIPIPFVGRREAKSGRSLKLLLGLTTLVVVASIVAVATWWSPIRSTGTELWSSFQYTLVAMGIWVAALGAALWKRPALLSHKANAFLAGLVLLPVVAGALQLSEPGFGGRFGERVIGPSATEGIFRIAGILAVALIAAAPVSALRVLQHGVDRTQRLGIWIGMRSTEGSQRVGAGFRLLRLGGRFLEHKVWRLEQNSLGLYRRYPIHLILIAWASTGIIWAVRPIQKRLSRSGPEADTYPEPGLVFAGVSGGSEGVAVAEPPTADPIAGPLVDDPASENLPPWLQDEEYDVDEHEEPTTLDVVPPDEAPQEVASDPIASEAAVLDDEPPADEPQPVVIDLSGGEARSGGTISATNTSWKLPLLDLLKSGERRVVSEEEHQATARLIEQTLGEYSIEVSVREIRPGPVVTQYGIVPGWI